MKNFLKTSLVVVAGLAAGCSLDRTTGPAQVEPGFASVRYTEQADGQEVVSIEVASDGVFELVDQRGEGATTRGLLAGEKLETLVRLVGALPPPNVTSPFPCGTSDDYTMSIVRNGEVACYAWNDSAPSDGEADLAGYLGEMTRQVPARKNRQLSFTVLAQGNESHIREPRREIIRDRDHLVALMREHQPGGTMSIPRVDFTNHVVAVCYLGVSTKDAQVGVDGVDMTEAGWVRVSLRASVAGDRCGSSGVESVPYVWVAIEDVGTDLYFERNDVVRACDGAEPAAPGLHGARF